jgi:hypothetical protein
MPIIPQGKENIRMNPNSPVPIAGTAENRLAGESIAGFGKELQQFGAQLYNADRKLKIDEGANELENVAKLSREHALRTTKPDGSDYLEKMNEFAAPKIEEVYSKYGTDNDVRDKLSSYERKLRNNMAVTATIDSASIREDDFFNRLGKLQEVDDNSMREFARTKQDSELSSLNNMAKAQLTKGTLRLEEHRDMFNQSRGNYEKLKNNQKTGLAYAIINGLSESQPDKALQILQASSDGTNLELTPAEARERGFIDASEEKALSDKGEKFNLPLLTDKKAQMSPELISIMEGLTPEQKARAIDKLKSELKVKSEQRLSELNETVKSAEYLAIQGKFLPKDREKVIADIMKNDKLTSVARQRLVDNVKGYAYLSDSVELLEATPRSEWGKILQREKVNDSDDVVSRAGKLERSAKLVAAADRLEKLQKDDPQAYIRKDPEILNLRKGATDSESMKRYIETSFAKQDSLGIPRSILTKQEAANEAAAISGIPDSTTLDMYLTQKQGMYGANFPKYINELAEVNKDLKAYKSLAYVGVNERTSFVDALANKKQILERINTDSVAKVNAETINTQVSSLLMPVSSVIAAAGNDTSSEETINGLHEAVSLQAKRDYVKGNFSGDLKELTKKAYESVVGKVYAMPSGGKSTVLLPRQLGVDEKIVSSFLQVYSDKENLKDFISNPKVLEISDSFKWITNKDQTGVKLVMDAGSMGVQPVMGLNRKPVEVKYQDINLRPSQKVLDKFNNRSTLRWHKGFGG